MDIQIDFYNKAPLSAQIESAILDEVTSGRLAPGTQLPTVRELATQLRVNFNTVARAYRSLDAQGWINTRQGRGSFISRKAEQKPPLGEKAVEDAALPEMVQRIIQEARQNNVSLTTLTAALLQHCETMLDPPQQTRKRQIRRFQRKPPKRAMAFQPGKISRRKKTS